MIILFLTTILLFLSFGFIIFVSIYFLEALLLLGKPNAPLVWTKNNLLSEISKHIDIKENSNVCDLGSGDGRVIFYLAERNKSANFVGIERSFFPFFVSKIKLGLKGYKNIVFRKKDFLDYDLSNFNIFITYLYPSIMNMLLPKFEKEIKKGAVLYSIDFEFTNKKADKVIKLSGTKHRGEKIFIYNW